MNKNQNPKLKTIVGVILCLAALLSACFGQGIKDSRLNSGRAAQTFNQVTILPNVTSTGNTTNAFQVTDTQGTNFFRIAPTNAALQYRTGGILYTGVTCSVQFSNGVATAATITGVRTNLYFKNGLLVDGP